MTVLLIVLLMITACVFAYEHSKRRLMQAVPASPACPSRTSRAMTGIPPTSPWRGRRFLSTPGRAGTFSIPKPGSFWAGGSEGTAKERFFPDGSRPAPIWNRGAGPEAQAVNGSTGRKLR